MNSPPVKGVVFDLWKTVVPFPDEVKREAYEATARLLGMSPLALKPFWDRGRIRRETQPFLQFLHVLRDEVGATWSDQILEDVAAARRTIHSRTFEACDADTHETLDMLRAAGMKLALVSNCSSDVRQMLDDSRLCGSFDATLLSAEFGIMKPDPRIFREAVARLQLRPEECLYVGDGLDDELIGAAAVGLTPVLLDPVGSTEWTGRRIKTIGELKRLVEVTA